MTQDKNFHIRLRAAVDKRLREYGVIDFSPMPPDVPGTSKYHKVWAFIESLDEITLEYLQGEKSNMHLANSTIEQLKKGDRFKFNYEIFKVTRKWIDDNRPLIAINEIDNVRHDFSHEGLEIEKL